MSGGWAVCPVCGAVVADTWEHAAWHETRLADLIVDVVDGRAVQLQQGVAGSGWEFGDPLEAALAWQEAGAQWLHQHFKDIGVRATVDMSLAPDQRVGRRPQAKPPKPARRTAAP